MGCHAPFRTGKRAEGNVFISSTQKNALFLLQKGWLACLIVQNALLHITEQSMNPAEIQQQYLTMGAMLYRMAFQLTGNAEENFIIQLLGDLKMEEIEMFYNSFFSSE